MVLCTSRPPGPNCTRTDRSTVEKPVARKVRYSYIHNMKYERKVRKSKVGERGQVTIPKVFRARYGVRPGQEVVFEETEDGLLLRKVTRDDPFRTLLGCVQDAVDVDEYLEHTRGPGWTGELDG